MLNKEELHAFPDAPPSLEEEVDQDWDACNQLTADEWKELNAELDRKLTK